MMAERRFRVTMALIVIFWLILLAYAAASVSAKSASGGTDCATAQTAGDNHIAVDWPAGAQNPIDTFAGAAPSADMFGVLSCGDGRHVEYQWLTGAPKASFSWGQ